MKYSNILITGGAGFIGSSLGVFLKTKYPSINVTALDNLKRRGSEMNCARLREHGVGFVHGDIRVPEDMAVEGPVDLLIECSAEPSVLAGYGDNPRYIINTNLTGTVNCLELLRAHRADIVFLSTSRVYPYEAINALGVVEKRTRYEWGSNQKACGWSKQGIEEVFTLTGPRTLYGATKLASELLIQEYMTAYGLKGVINRCGVIAGPGQFGKVDQGVFTFWMLAHYFKRPLKYIGFGGNGKQVRDLLHIDDLCALIDRQVNSLDRISGNVYNAGGGRDVSLSLHETTQLCEQITGNRLRIGKGLKERPGDVRIYIGDNSRVSGELKWKPQRSAHTILFDTYRWIRENEARIRAALDGHG